MAKTSTTSSAAAKPSALSEASDASVQPVNQLTQPDPPNQPPLPASYEAGLQELERLVAGLESGQLPLDQLLTAYQRGAQLLAFCRSRLEAVENQIKVLDGNELKPWVPADR